MITDEMIMERDLAQSACTAWRDAFLSIEAHLKDRIEMDDPAKPLTYLAIIQAEVADVDRSSKSIVNARWADSARYQKRIAELESAQPGSPLRGVTDEMVERAWAAIVGGDIAKECSHTNIIRADLKTGLYAALAPAVGGEALTLELEDASNACLELCAKHGFATGHGDTVSDMIREIDGQIAPPASPLRGRYLDWQEVVADRGDGFNEISGYEADSGFGPWYYIDIYFGSDSLGWDVSYDSTQLGDTDDPDKAKQLAQSDFEKRVLSAVSASPPEQPKETP